jgi:hypothetical protein
MKILGMLGRSDKPQDRGKATYSDKVLDAIGHPSYANDVLVEECGIELEDHFIISIVLKVHNLLKSMIVTHINDILEGFTILVLLHESPILPLHRNNWSMLALVDRLIPISMKVGPKARIRSNLVWIIAWGVPMSDDGLGVLFHVVGRGPLTTRMLNRRVNAEELLFFLIRRNRRRWTKSDFASMWFLCFGGGGSSNILGVLDPFLSHTTGVGRVRHSPVIEEEMYEEQEENQGRIWRNGDFWVETITRRYIWHGSDMSDLG